MKRRVFLAAAAAAIGAGTLPRPAMGVDGPISLGHLAFAGYQEYLGSEMTGNPGRSKRHVYSWDLCSFKEDWERAAQVVLDGGDPREMFLAYSAHLTPEEAGKQWEMFIVMRQYWVAAHSAVLGERKYTCSWIGEVKIGTPDEMAEMIRRENKRMIRSHS